MRRVRAGWIERSVCRSARDARVTSRRGRRHHFAAATALRRDGADGGEPAGGVGFDGVEEAAGHGVGLAGAAFPGFDEDEGDAQEGGEDGLADAQRLAQGASASSSQMPTSAQSWPPSWPTITKSRLIRSVA